MMIKFSFPLMLNYNNLMNNNSYLNRNGKDDLTVVLSMYILALLGFRFNACRAANTRGSLFNYVISFHRQINTSQFYALR